MVEAVIVEKQAVATVVGEEAVVEGDAAGEGGDPCRTLLAFCLLHDSAFVLFGSIAVRMHAHEQINCFTTALGRHAAPLLLSKQDLAQTA